MPAEYQISEHYNGSVRIKFWPGSHRYQLEGRKDYLIGVTTATGMMDKSRPLVLWATRLARDYLLELHKIGPAISALEIEVACNLHAVKKEEAATSGSMVHAWAESYIKGENPVVPEDEKVRNGVIAFLNWVRDNDVKFLASEKRVYSKKHEYVGTMDCIFTMGRENHKIIHAGDFKTSSGIYLEMAFQVSGYQQAETEEHGTVYGSKWILRFQKEDKFEKDTVDDDGKIVKGKLVCAAGTFEAKEFSPEEHVEHFKGFLGCLELKKQDKIWEARHGYYSKK